MRRAVVAIASLTAALFIALYGWGRDRAPFETLEGETLDWRFALRGPLAPGGDVVILSVDERSIETLGGWPLPRRVLGEAVERLNAAGAKVVAFDLLLLELEPSTVGGGPGFGDQRLIAAIRAAPTTVLPFAMNFEGGAEAAPPGPEIMRSALRIRRGSDDAIANLPHPISLAAPPAALMDRAHGAHATVALEEDGSLRSVNLALPFAGELYPALPLEAVRLFLGVAADEVIVELDRGLKLGALTIETQPGLRLPVNYYGPPGTFETVAMRDLIAGSVEPARLRGKLVLVGATALGLGDRFSTSFSRVFPGVEFFATAADNLLTGRWLRRDDLAAISDIGAILALAGLAAALGLRFSAGLAAPAILALAALWFAGAALAFARWQIWLNVMFPASAAIVAGAAAVLLRAIAETRARRLAEGERSRLARYVPEAIAEELARSERPRFDERVQPASILFVDMAGFTQASESMQGSAMLALIRRLHGLIEAAVRAHGGLVDKYIGDGAMILFGLPEPKLDDAARALACCRAIAEELDRWNEERLRAGEPAVALGAGLHHGPVIVARIGERHSQVTAMGDSVNVASRLERVTREIGARIVLSDAVASAVRALGRDDLLAGFSYSGERALRGRDQAVGIWRWPADASAAQAGETADKAPAR